MWKCCLYAKASFLFQLFYTLLKPLYRLKKCQDQNRIGVQIDLLLALPVSALVAVKLSISLMSTFWIATMGISEKVIIKKANLCEMIGLTSCKSDKADNFEELQGVYTIWHCK